MSDREKLEILAAWHTEQAVDWSVKVARTPRVWIEGHLTESPLWEQRRQLAAHHLDAADLLRRLAENLKENANGT